MRKTAVAVFVLSLFLVMLSGCNKLKTKRSTHIRSYTLNVEGQSVVGPPILISEFNTYGRSSQKHGLTEEQNAWQSYEFTTLDSYKEKLIYMGRSGDIIRVTYQHFKIDDPSPDYSQELTFDITSNALIQFKSYKIRVINATDQYIRFQVVGD
ncbi:MAG: hypothetical protein JSU99_10365 [Nitrospiraceae bacterium]|nr:MAG: hypothetical protein JSU99_10365 [Nitrospiraceae bacterium]